MVKDLAFLNFIKFNSSLTNNNFVTVVNIIFKTATGFVKLVILKAKVSNSVKTVMTTKCSNIQRNIIWDLISLLWIKTCSIQILVFLIIEKKMLTITKKYQNFGFNRIKGIVRSNLTPIYQWGWILKLHQQLDSHKC